jgi:hypothetical protein
MAEVKKLVSEAEVDAAMEYINRASAFAGRVQPIPRTLMRCILEESAMERTGMRRAVAFNADKR